MSRTPLRSYHVAPCTHAQHSTSGRCSIEAWTAVSEFPPSSELKAAASNGHPAALDWQSTQGSVEVSVRA